MIMYCNSCWVTWQSGAAHVIKYTLLEWENRVISTQMGRCVLLGGIFGDNMVVTVICRCVKMLSEGVADATV